MSNLDEELPTTAKGNSHPALGTLSRIFPVLTGHQPMYFLPRECAALKNENDMGLKENKQQQEVLILTTPFF